MRAPWGAYRATFSRCAAPPPLSGALCRLAESPLPQSLALERALLFGGSAAPPAPDWMDRGDRVLLHRDTCRGAVAAAGCDLGPLRAVGVHGTFQELLRLARVANTSATAEAAAAPLRDVTSFALRLRRDGAWARFESAYVRANSDAPPALTDAAWADLAGPLTAAFDRLRLSLARQSAAVTAAAATAEIKWAVRGTGKGATGPLPAGWATGLVMTSPTPYPLPVFPAPDRPLLHLARAAGGAARVRSAGHRGGFPARARPAPAAAGAGVRRPGVLRQSTRGGLRVPARPTAGATSLPSLLEQVLAVHEAAGSS